MSRATGANTPVPSTPPPTEPDADPLVDTGAFPLLDVNTRTDLHALRLQQLVETFTSNTPTLTPEELAANGAPTGDPEPEPEVPQPIVPCAEVGTVINDLYRIDGLIAQGGMGQVFLAYHLRREIPVVLKLMLRRAEANDTPFMRFMQECRIMDRLKHPNVVKVLDYGILFDGLKPYLVMEFVPGRSLRQLLRKRLALQPADTAQILAQACDALDTVHAKGIIHRDLKPENVMVRGNHALEDNVKILDFGIAQLQNNDKFNEEGWAVGSLGYMSPEQIMGNPVDHRTDIYSLGLILYECTAGCPPFRGNTAKETMALHVKQAHVPPSQLAKVMNPQMVDYICDRALAKNPADRYQTAGEMKQDLFKLFPPKPDEGWIGG